MGEGEQREKMRWGTLEELLLGCAVARHGTQNWELVSFELEARFPHGFSAEACKAKYDALQGRFKARESSDGISWLLEELRRLRVSQLRKDLQRSDDSIESLRSKLERLEAERAQNVKERSGGGGGGEDGRGGDSKPCSEGDGRSKDRSSAGSFTDAAAPEGAETGAWAPLPPATDEHGTDCCEIDKSDGIQSGRGDEPDPDRESNPLPARENSYDARAVDAAAGGGFPKGEGDPDPAKEKKVAGSVSEAAQAQVAPRVEVAPTPPPPKSEGHPTSPLDSFYGSSETLAEEENRKLAHDFAESKNSDIEGGRPRPDAAQKRANLRSNQPCRRPRSNSWGLISHKLKAESDGEEELKRAEPADFRQKNPEEPPADVKSEPDQEQDRTSIGCTENSGLQTVDTNASEKSAGPIRRKRGIRPQEGNNGRGFRATDVHSETSSPRLAADDEEGSAESMDTEDDKTFVKQAHKGGGPAGDSDVLSAVNPAELPSRRGGSKAFSTSHGSGRNRREARYKESEDFTRSSGDSHMDTDRPGSQAEGTDEIETSPMSKRSRREPKVPGKLLPLLECLRTISSHKFGPLFRHRLESQKQQQYRNVIRRHMDLGTIRARLEEGSYSGSLEFFRDLLLIFNNALVYYPKTSQEHAAAWVLRQVAAKEMENIFKTEALLKQEGPSTRKREPKKGPEPSMKFNPASSIGVSRKRNTRSSIPAARTKPPRLSFEQFPKEDEECNKSEQLKEAAMELSSSTLLKAKPKPKFGPESDKKPEAITLQKFKEGSKEGQEKKMRENTTTAASTTTTTSAPAIKAFGNNNMQPKKSIVDSIKVSNSEPKRSGSDESKKLFGSIVPGNKTVKKVLQHGIPASEPESEPHRGQPPAKRGVGRPPKHAKKSATTYSQPHSKFRDSDPPSKPRKKARR